MVESTDRRQRVLDFIIGYKAGHDGLGPTYREIGTACDISTTSVVKCHLNALEKAGLIEVMEGQARGIMVTGGKWQPPTILGNLDDILEGAYQKAVKGPCADLT